MNKYQENCTALIPVWETGIIKNVLSVTCKIISPYVKKIVVLHCGPKSEFEKSKEYFANINNLHIEHFEYTGEAESVLRYLTTFVPKNEWALFLDSDHRPTESLLLNLKKFCQFSPELTSSYLRARSRSSFFSSLQKFFFAPSSSTPEIPTLMVNTFFSVGRKRN
jgi:hypothetical protein